MSTKIQIVAFKLMDILVLLTMVLGMPMNVAAAPLAQDATPVLATDKADYALGESAHFTGTGFAAGDYSLAINGAAWGTVTVPIGGNFAADSSAFDSTGDYELRAYPSPWSGDWNELPVASASFTVTEPPPPTDTPTEPPTATEPPTEPPTATQPPTDVPTETTTTEPTSAPTDTPAPTETALPSPTPTLETPTIQSDYADYNPGQLVRLTGTGWIGDTTVIITVVDAVPTVYHDTDQVQVQADGTIIDSFNLPTTFIDRYFVTARGVQTGRTATTTFTDANPSADIDQCANDPAPSPSTDGCNTAATQWDNGNLGASKSVYFEGDSIPYRLKFDNLSLAPHTVIIEWDTTKGDKHAIDYITTFNQSVLNADPCLGVSGCSTFNTYPIPADPQVTGAGVTPIAGNFRLYGGTITSVSAYSYPNGTGFIGDKSARIAITFTASVANPV
ncbi:MAG TPA: hypothetical protein VFC02_25245, partial [Anaerolineales bacterium]|nr:hypothetical protein [Anaerolineales bacterium]